MVYNSPLALRLLGLLNIKALEDSLNEITRRHGSVRTTFDVQNGKPVQVVTSSLSVPIHVIDLTELPRINSEAEAFRLAAEEARRPFDLRIGPLFRASLIILDPQDHLLILNMHHLITDEWSFDVLTQELSILYEAMCGGKPTSLPELHIQYVDFVVWQREWLKGEKLDNHLAFWKRYLSGTPSMLKLPADRPRPAVRMF